MISVRPGDDIAAIYDVRPRQTGEPRLRAAFVVLAMNRDGPGVVLSMQRLLRRFNNTDIRCVCLYHCLTWVYGCSTHTKQQLSLH